MVEVKGVSSSFAKGSLKNHSPLFGILVVLSLFSSLFLPIYTPQSLLKPQIQKKNQQEHTLSTPAHPTLNNERQKTKESNYTVEHPLVSEVEVL
jgi:hypothetical protein